MRKYIFKRILLMIPTLILCSVLIFVVMELPEGNCVTRYVQQMEASGMEVSESYIAALNSMYHLDKTPVERYFIWAWGLLRGDLGNSFTYNLPVADVILPRMGYTIGLSLSAMILGYAISIPLGIISAVKQNTLADYGINLFAYLGMSVPSFILGILLLYVNARYFGNSVGGLFSPEFQDAAWSWAKVVDLFKHVWIALVIITFGGTAGTIRGVRYNLLDELKKPYVEHARTKGLSETSLLLKYPFRISANPMISGMAGLLSSLVGGESILSMVLSLPTVGPLAYEALQNEDTYLAGAYLMLCSLLLIVGTIISDILLAICDPRIRYE